MGQVSKPDVDFHVSTTSLDTMDTHLLNVVLHHQLTAQEAAMIEDALKMMLPWIIKGVLSL